MTCIGAVTLLYLLKTRNYKQFYYNRILRNFIKHQDPYKTSDSKILVLQVSLLPLNNSFGFKVVLWILTSGVISTLLARQQEVHLVKIDQQNSEITRYFPQETPLMHHKVVT